VGPPRSGKGVWARTTRQLVGHHNFASITLQSLADRFGTQTLIGKSVAVISDARISGRTDAVTIAERLLAISGEDSPAVQRKNLPDWEGALSRGSRSCRTSCPCSQTPRAPCRRGS